MQLQNSNFYRYPPNSFAITLHNLGSSCRFQNNFNKPNVGHLH